MLGIGFTEMLLLAGIALVVMGPEKFPDFAKMAVRLVKDVRGYWDEAQRELVKEINPIKQEIKQLQKYDAEEFIDHLAGNKPGSKTPEELDPTLAEPGATGYGVKVPEPDADDDLLGTPPPAGPDPNDPYTLNQPYNANAGKSTDSLDAVSAALAAGDEPTSEAPHPSPATEGLEAVAEALESAEDEDEEFEPKAPPKLD